MAHLRSCQMSKNNSINPLPFILLCACHQFLHNCSNYEISLSNSASKTLKNNNGTKSSDFKVVDCFEDEKQRGSVCSILSERTMNERRFQSHSIRNEFHEFQGAVATIKLLRPIFFLRVECSTLGKCTLGKSLTVINYISIFAGLWKNSITPTLRIVFCVWRSSFQARISVWTLRGKKIMQSGCWEEKTAKAKSSDCKLPDNRKLFAFICSDL